MLQQRMPAGRTSDSPHNAPNTVVPAYSSPLCSNSVCNGEGECWEVAGLFIADGSSLPTASGVNPMVTIEAVAHLVSSRVGRRFKAGRAAQQQRNGNSL